MLLLALDTATGVATSALVRDGVVLGERVSRAVTVLADADRLLRAAGLEARDLDAVVVGTGPGSFTGLRIGLAAVRGLGLGLGLPVAGVSTLDALAAGAHHLATDCCKVAVLPVIDARRQEVFVLLDGEPYALRPEKLELEPGTVCVGDGALRYREVLDAAGADVPPRESPLHTPFARHHAALARDFGPADLVEPIYVRLPDAKRALA